MTEIDFHTADGIVPALRLRHACELTERAFRRGQRVHILVTDADEAARLDQLLWVFRDLAFIPHAVNPPDPAAWPVTLGIEHAEADPRHLINLSSELPGYYDRYPHIDEIVDDAGKLAARERYRQYRDRGAQLRHHRLEQGLPLSDEEHHA